MDVASLIVSGVSTLYNIGASIYSNSKSSQYNNEQQLLANQNEFQETLLAIDDTKYNLGVDNDWLYKYQLYARGDRESTEFGRNISILEEGVNIANKEKAVALKGQEIKNKNAYEEGLENYKNLEYNKAMMNVYAGGSGEKTSSYSSEALKRQNDIRRFIGDDMKLNRGAISYSGGGTFLDSYAYLISTNTAEIMKLNQNINASQNALISQKEEYKDQAEAREKSRSEKEQALHVYDQKIHTLLDNAQDLINKKRDNIWWWDWDKSQDEKKKEIQNDIAKYGKYSGVF